MNRIEAAASATPAPLEIVVEERPVACTFAWAAQYAENVRHAFANHQRHVDGGEGNGFADALRVGGLTASRENLSATALLALRA